MNSFLPSFHKRFLQIDKDVPRTCMDFPMLRICDCVQKGWNSMA